MNSRRVPTTPPVFAQAVEDLRVAVVRPQIALTEIPAPQRIAPHSLALSAEVVLADRDEPAASGRFVLLYDPATPEAWESPWRVVTFATADLEPEMASEPMLGEVGWSWLTDALDAADVRYRALGGTVTRVVSESFASLAERGASVEMEVRASWSPAEDHDIADHLHVWADLLCTVAGVPPLPAGVTALPAHRRQMITRP